MKLATGWNMCTFVSETPDDKKLLTKLFEKIIDEGDVTVKVDKNHQIKELNIYTYF